MISLIELQNTVLSNKVKLTQDITSPFTLLSIDVGKVDGIHTQYQNYDGVGNNISSTAVGPRSVTIDIAVWDNTRSLTEQERLKKIESHKKELNVLVNPFQDIIVKIGNYFLRGRPQSNINYSTNYRENNDIKCTGVISILCSMPLYQLVTPAATTIAGIEGGFMFPLILPPEGIYMGIKKSFSLISVENDGDVDIGGRLTIIANGTIINPEFTDIVTDNKMKLNITLQKGDSVTIDSRVNNESVTGVIAGVEQNLYRFFDYTDSFFIYKTGITLLGYTAEEETYKNMDAKIELYKLYNNIEEE